MCTRHEFSEPVVVHRLVNQGRLGLGHRNIHRRGEGPSYKFWQEVVILIVNYIFARMSILFLNQPNGILSVVAIPAQYVVRHTIALWDSGSLSSPSSVSQYSVTASASPSVFACFLNKQYTLSLLDKSLDPQAYSLSERFCPVRSQEQLAVSPTKIRGPASSLQRVFSL